MSATDVAGSPHSAARSVDAPAPDPYDNRFTRQFGVPGKGPQTKMRPFLTDEVKAFIGRSPFLVMSTSDAEGHCDASPRGGKPGFVAVLDDHHLLVPDVAGNRLFQSYLNMEQNPHVGLLFMIPGLNDTVRVNGTVTFLDKDAVEARHVSLSINNPDANSKLLQGILVEIEDAYTHCPRSFRFAAIWNTEAIEQNQRA